MITMLFTLLIVYEGPWTEMRPEFLAGTLAIDFQIGLVLAAWII